jgi:hypothetical protein
MVLLLISAAGSVWMWIPWQWFYLTLAAVVSLGVLVSVLLLNKYLGWYALQLVLALGWAAVWSADISWLTDTSSEWGHSFDQPLEWVGFGIAICVRCVVSAVRGPQH